MVRWVTADIHGNNKALQQCIAKSNFDFERDELIVLGDICDGYNCVYQVIETLLQIKHLILIAGNHDCVDLKTEILTRRGWLKHDQITLEDEVMSYDIKTNTGRWGKINKIIKKPYKGKMINIKSNKFFHMVVTPTHRVLCKNYTRRRPNFNHVTDEEYSYTLAKDLFENSDRIRFPICSLMKKSDYNVSDEVIALTAWILTDSFINKYGYVVFYQSKQDNVDHIKSLLFKVGISYKDLLRDRQPNIIKGKIVKSHLVAHEFHLGAENSRELLKICNLTSKNEIPRWVFELSERQYDIFMLNLIKANGTFYDRGNPKTSILYGKEDMLSQIQATAIIHGYSSTLTIDNRGDPRLNISDKDSVSLDQKSFYISDNEEGRVWCLDTEIGNFLARRDGKPFYTGNCWTLQFLKGQHPGSIWTRQGGSKTLESYRVALKVNDISTIRTLFPQLHHDLLSAAKVYYIDNKNYIYVHGGFDDLKPINEQDPNSIIWDRELCSTSRIRQVKKYDRVFVGHTDVRIIYGKNDDLKPKFHHNLIMVDTGAGYNGKLTFINPDTLEYVQSTMIKA